MKGDAFYRQAEALMPAPLNIEDLQRDAKAAAQELSLEVLRGTLYSNGWLDKSRADTAQEAEMALSRKCKTLQTVADALPSAVPGRTEQFVTIFAQMERYVELMKAKAKQSKEWLAISTEQQESKQQAVQQQPPRDQPSLPPNSRDFAGLQGAAPPPPASRGAGPFGAAGGGQGSRAARVLGQSRSIPYPGVAVAPNPSSVGAAAAGRLGGLGGPLLPQPFGPLLPGAAGASGQPRARRSLCDHCQEPCSAGVLSIGKFLGQDMRICADCYKELQAAALAAAPPDLPAVGADEAICQGCKGVGAISHMRLCRLISGNKEEFHACANCAANHRDWQPVVVPKRQQQQQQKPPPPPRRAAARPAPVPAAAFGMGRGSRVSELNLRPTSAGTHRGQQQQQLATAQRPLKQPALAQQTLLGKRPAPAAAPAPPPAPAHGTDANPILLPSDSEDEDSEAAALAAAVAAAAAADAGERRATRAAAAAPPSWRRFAGLRFMFPPEGGRDSVEVRAEDLARLAPDEFLNDTAIDFYLRWLQRGLAARDPAAAERCYFFNSFFYKKLTEKNAKVPARGPDSSGLRDEAALAAANFPQVRKWTKGVDLFAKDFLFVPIHDNLHWSLIIVCHPGAEPREAAGGAGGGGGGGARGRRSSASAGGGRAGATPPDEGGADARAAPAPEPFLLHLDSMRGGHASVGPAAVLQQYLTDEWRVRAGAGSEGQGEGVPRAWADAHPGAPPRAFSAANLRAIKPAVPAQTNHCDCGLFVCAYVEFFTAALPPALNHAAVTALRRGYARDGRELWEAAEAEAGAAGAGASQEGQGGGGAMEAAPGEEGQGGAMAPAPAPALAFTPFPGFLTREWFLPANASNLRWELHKMMLLRMGQDARLLDAHGMPLLADGVPPERQAQLAALLDDLEALDRRQQGGGQQYVRPAAWRDEAAARKVQRALDAAEKVARARAAAERAAEEREEGKRQRAARRASAAAGPAEEVELGSDEDDFQQHTAGTQVGGGPRRSGRTAAHDPHLAAAAAERRQQRGAPAAAAAATANDAMFDAVFNDAGNGLQESPDGAFVVDIDADGAEQLAAAAPRRRQRAGGGPAGGGASSSDEDDGHPLQPWERTVGMEIRRGLEPAPAGREAKRPRRAPGGVASWSDDDVGAVSLVDPAYGSASPSPSAGAAPPPLPPPPPARAPTGARKSKAAQAAQREQRAGAGAEVISLVAESPPAKRTRSHQSEPALPAGGGGAALDERGWGSACVDAGDPPPVDLASAVSVLISTAPGACSLEMRLAVEPVFMQRAAGEGAERRMLEWYHTWAPRLPPACARDLPGDSESPPRQALGAKPRKRGGRGPAAAAVEAVLGGGSDAEDAGGGGGGGGGSQAFHGAPAPTQDLQADDDEEVDVGQHDVCVTSPATGPVPAAAAPYPKHIRFHSPDDDDAGSPGLGAPLLEDSRFASVPAPPQQEPPQEEQEEEEEEEEEDGGAEQSGQARGKLAPLWSGAKQKGPSGGGSGGRATKRARKREPKRGENPQALLKKAAAAKGQQTLPELTSTTQAQRAAAARRAGGATQEEEHVDLT